MYSPYQGRFISVDPTGFASGDANLYRAEENNPVNVLDPSGLQPPPGPRGELGAGGFLGGKGLMPNSKPDDPKAGYTVYPGKWRVCMYTSSLAGFYKGHAWMEVTPIPPTKGERMIFGSYPMKVLIGENPDTPLALDPCSMRCTEVTDLKIPNRKAYMSCAGHCMAIWSANIFAPEYFLPQFLGVLTIAGTEQLAMIIQAELFPVAPRAIPKPNAFVAPMPVEAPVAPAVPPRVGHRGARPGLDPFGP